LVDIKTLEREEIGSLNVAWPLLEVNREIYGRGLGMLVTK
jgi:hypothetical protein